MEHILPNFFKQTKLHSFVSQYIRVLLHIALGFKRCLPYKPDIDGSAHLQQT
jgi:hypothetical protein